MKEGSLIPEEYKDCGSYLQDNPPPNNEQCECNIDFEVKEDMNVSEILRRNK